MKKLHTLMIVHSQKTAECLNSRLTCFHAAQTEANCSQKVVNHRLVFLHAELSPAGKNYKSFDFDSTLVDLIPFCSFVCVFFIRPESVIVVVLNERSSFLSDLVLLPSWPLTDNDRGVLF